jgi:hypothetical protein
MGNEEEVMGKLWIDFVLQQPFLAGAVSVAVVLFGIPLLARLFIFLSRYLESMDLAWLVVAGLILYVLITI